MAFDPDAYLAKQKGGFNPDDYLAKPDNENGRLRSAAENIVESLRPAEALPMAESPKSIPEKLSNYLTRLYEAHKETMTPPTSTEAALRMVSPSAGKFGLGKFLEEEGKNVGAAVRPAADKMAEDFVTLPGVNKFPVAASIPAALGSQAVDTFSDSLTPSSAQMSLGVEGAGVAATELAPALRSMSRTAGRRALGYTKGMLNKPGALEKANNVARIMQKEGVITPLATTEKMAERVAALEEKSGKAIGDVLKQLDESGTRSFRPIDVAIRVEKELPSSSPGLVGGAYTAEQNIIKEIEDTILAHGDEPLTFQAAQDLKNILQENGKFGAGGDSVKNAMYRKASGIVKDELEKSVELAGGPGLSKVYKPAKEIYGATQDAGKALTNRASSVEGNKRFGLTDTILAGSGGTAALLGHPEAALMTGGGIAVKKFFEKFGNTINAASTEGLAKIVEHMPEILGKYGPILQAALKRGPEAFSVANYLQQQHDPEYRATLKAIQNGAE